MKRYSIFLILVITLAFLAGCQKDNFNYKPGYVGRSKITTYPVITVTGPGYFAVPKGGTFTDPGVSAKAGTTDVPVKTTSTIDVNTVGVYSITYTATNSDGFSVTASRHVVVYSTDASAQANDFSGNYARSSNGSVSTWTKIAPGVYSVFNPGGAPGTNLTVIVFNSTGNNVVIPQQNASDGSLTSSSSESTVPGPNGTLLTYKWVIINPTYGTALRTFNKQ